MVFAALAVQRVLTLAVMAVLARLLTPEDYGLVGMVVAIVAFLQVFADFGLSLATVQRQELTRQQLSTLFWLNVAFGAVLTLVAAASAPLVARFYREPRLIEITLWMSLGIVVAAVGAQPAALLTRRMSFGKLALCDLCAFVAGAGVGVALAARGSGPYALVAQGLTQVGVRAGLAWLLSGWMPGRPDRSSGVRSMLRFGGYLSGFNIVNYAARNLDKILLGRAWGAADVGLYTRAYSLMILPITLVVEPVRQVSMPALSKLQADLEHLKEAYVKTLRVMGMLSFPMMVGLAVTAEETVTLVYGGRWVAAIPIFRILCLAGFWQGIYSATGQLFIAVGRTDRMFRVGIVATVVQVAAFAIGARYGGGGMAVAYTGSLVVVLPGYLWYSYATVGLSLWKVISGLAPAVAASLAIVPTAWYAAHVVPATIGPLGVLAAKVISGFAVYWLVLGWVRPADLRLLVATLAQGLGHARG